MKDCLTASRSTSSTFSYFFLVTAITKKYIEAIKEIIAKTRRTPANFILPGLKVISKFSACVPKFLNLSSIPLIALKSGFIKLIPFKVDLAKLKKLTKGWIKIYEISINPLDAAEKANSKILALKIIIAIKSKIKFIKNKNFINPM